MIIELIPEYSDQKTTVDWHISHEYSEEMSKKSKTIPLGVQLLDENNLDQMCQILDNLHIYCPKVPSVEEHLLPDGESYTFNSVAILDILFGGDQMTCVRARTAKLLRSSHDNPENALHGIVPVVEDWHARMCLLRVIWSRLFKQKSSMEKGTLYQLKNLLNRSSVPTDPGNNMKAAEDFLLTVLSSHVLVAAKTIINELLPGSLDIHQLSQLVVSKFVPFLNPTNHSATENERRNSNSELTIVDGVFVADINQTKEKCDDGIFVYACEVLSLGLLWHCFHDAVKEGDGRRVITIWKYLLLVFKASNRKNYSKEAVILLLQYQYLFSKRKANQLMWDRFVNTKGLVGCNLPTDLHMEHLNRRFKTVIRNVGANINPRTITRAAKSIGVVHSICSTFEKQLGQKKMSGSHNAPSVMKEINTIVTLLQEIDIFVEKKRKYESFVFKNGLICSINRDQIGDWILDKALKVVAQL